jgi:hypothetical protein
MAFGNYSYNPKPKIDFSKLKAVDVNVVFNTLGEMKPLSFRYVLPDESIDIYKKEIIKFTRDKGDRISFYCMITNHGRQQEVILTFYVMECIWVVE